MALINYLRVLLEIRDFQNYRRHYYLVEIALAEIKTAIREIY